jgi:hypothetical protein
LVALACVACVGCGDSANVAPVAGIVTLDGKPLVGASVTTQPIAAGSAAPGSGSFGTTDDQGRFELELVKPAVKGAIIGEHRVMISPASDDAANHDPKTSAAGVEYWSDDPSSHRAAAKSKWPAQFTDGSLHLTVPPEGAAEVRFDLKR